MTSTNDNDPEVTVHNERCEFVEETATSGSLHCALHAEHRGRHRTAGGYEFGPRIDFPRRPMTFQAQSPDYVGGRVETLQPSMSGDGHIHEWQWFDTQKRYACTHCQIPKYTVEPVESWAKNLKQADPNGAQFAIDSTELPPPPTSLKAFYPNVGTILFEIRAERLRQDELVAQGKFKATCADPNMSDLRALSVLAEEFGEVSREVNEKEESALGSLKFLEHKRNLREELIQTAAVCLAWVEKLDG